MESSLSLHMHLYASLSDAGQSLADCTCVAHQWSGHIVRSFAQQLMSELSWCAEDRYLPQVVALTRYQEYRILLKEMQNFFNTLLYLV
jgi:hypothetical protein